MTGRPKYAVLLLLLVYISIPVTILVDYTIREPVPQVPIRLPEHVFNGTAAYRLLQNLTAFYPHRVVGTQQENESAYWVADQFGNYHLNATLQVFPTVNFQGERVNGTNVYAVSNGTSKKTLLFLAHRDVTPSTSQGADDNGSGTVVLMELARTLTRTSHTLTYIFLSTDSEEINLGGGEYFAENTAIHFDIILALSIDEVGYKQEQSLLLYAYSHQNNFTDARFLLYAESVGQKINLPTYPSVSDQISRRAGIALFTSDSETFAAMGVQTYALGDPDYTYAETQQDTIDQVSPLRLDSVGKFVETLAFNMNQGILPPTIGSTYLVFPDGYIPEVPLFLHLVTYPIAAASSSILLFHRRHSKSPSFTKAARPVLLTFALLFGACLLPVAFRIAGLTVSPDSIAQYALIILWLAAFTGLSILLSGSKLKRLLGKNVEILSNYDKRAWAAAILLLSFLAYFVINPYAATIFVALPALLPPLAVAREHRPSNAVNLFVSLLSPLPIYSAAIASLLIFGLPGILTYTYGAIGAGGPIIIPLAAALAVLLSLSYTFRGSLAA